MPSFYASRAKSFITLDGPSPYGLNLTWRGSWNQTPAAGAEQGESVCLPYKDAGDQAGVTTASKTSPPNPWRLALMRWISEPCAAGTGSGTFDMCLAVAESTANANCYTKIYAYMTVGDTDAVRCVLIDYEGDVGTDTEWPVQASSGTFYNIDTPPSVNANSWQAGDRLVIEAGCISRGTTTYTARMYRGTQSGGTVLADAAVGDTTPTTRAGHFTFSAGVPAPRATLLQNGDLAVGNGSLVIYDGTTLEIKAVRYMPAQLGTAAGAQDADGNLYVTNELLGEVWKFDENLELVARYAVPSPLVMPHFVTFAQDGTFYVGCTGNTTNGPCLNFGGAVSTGGTGDIVRFNADGSVNAVISPAYDQSGTPSGDLMVDQRTIRYGSVGRKIKQWNTVLGQLADFATLPGSTPTYTVRGMKMLPDGTMLVADAADIKRLSAFGTVIQTYTDVAQADWGTLAPDPTGREYFWAANTGADTGEGVPMIAKFDLESGAVLERIYTPTDTAYLTGDLASQLCSGGIVVFGGYRAAIVGTTPAVIGPLVWARVPRLVP